VVTDALLRGMFENRRVEHLLAGASDDYIAERAEIARRYYRFARPLGDGEEAADLSPTARSWAKLGWTTS
jgi:hypothetical protein